MKIYPRSLLLIFFIVLLCLTLSNCKTHSPIHSSGSIAKRSGDVLRIGVSTHSPPLIYKENGKLQGLEVDFAHQLARYLGKKLQFIELPWTQQIESLESGDIDIIMSGMTITPKRQYRVNFSDPYLKSGQIMLIRMQDSRKFANGIYSVMASNYRVGTVKNTTGDFFVTQTLNGVKVTKFSKSQAAVNALIDKEIDVFIYDAPMIYHYAAMNENNKLTAIVNLLTNEDLAWAMNKNDRDLLEQVNTFIRENKKSKQLNSTINNRIPYLKL